MVADRPGPAFPEPPRGPQQPIGVVSETDRQLRGMATALGKLSVELPKEIAKAAEVQVIALREFGGVEASIDQVATEISDLTAAVREMTELLKEMAVFPRQSTTRRVLHWITQR